MIQRKIRSQSRPPSRPPLPSPRPFAPDGRAVILSPGNGAIVNGVVPIVGTAQHDQFDYYKLEWAAGGANQSFNYFDGAESPVSGGLLGNLDSGALKLANGVYTIRLVVVDSTGKLSAALSGHGHGSELTTAGYRQRPQAEWNGSAQENDER